MSSDYYQTLGVGRGASADAIKKAYRKLAHGLHPDRNPGDAAAEERFKEVSAAYAVLSNEKKRQLYDEFGEMGLREGFDPEMVRQQSRWADQGFGGAGGGEFSFNVEDLLRGVGGRGFGRASGFGGGVRPRKGGDLSSEVRVSFREAIEGCEKELSFVGPEDGQPRTLKVRIPAGVEDEGKVRLRGQGSAGRGGGPAGDLVLSVRVEPHPHFERQGADLLLQLPLTPHEAYAGAKVRVPTPEGEVQLRIPKLTQGGNKLRLKGRGVPRRGGGKGDLIVEIRIRIPTREDEAIAKAVETLSEGFEGDVREDLSW
ncbi:MAG: DnaJ domain-containing protein [Myxococcales bacterium]|nr:DnaJ domain-containing protein [Myxococcales bacterium]